MPQTSCTAKELAEGLLLALEAQGLLGSYRSLPDNFLLQVRSFESSHGVAARSELLRLLVLELSDRFTEISQRPYRLKMPKSILETQRIEDARIRQEFRNGEADATIMDVNNDLYLKDLGTVTLKLIPAGAQLLDIQQGVPRSILLTALKRSMSQGRLAAAYFAFRYGGFKPAIEIHTSLKRLDEFTPEGWRRCYGRIAELLAMNQQVLGMFGSSWFYDPIVPTISPRLTYLRQEPAEHGAQFFYVGPDAAATESAIATSSSRRQLYEQGKYQPCSYMLAWSRKDLISSLSST